MFTDVKKIAESCDCGKSHALSTHVIETSEDATERCIAYIKNNYAASAALIVCDENTKKYAEPIAMALCCRVFTHFAGAHANEIETARLSDYIKSSALPSVIIACGSGSIHDITRFCAYDINVDFISYPTAASVDGFVSGVAAMTMYGQKLTYTSASPVAIFADPAIYTKAPKRLVASGVGDIIGKITALTDWQAAHALTGEHLCPAIFNLMNDALKIIIDAAKGLSSAPTPEFTRMIMDGLILSGLAMQLQGNSRPASGAEHHMSHFWEMHAINAPTEALHGEKVGVGTIYVIKKLKQSRDMFCDGININLNRIFDSDMINSVYRDLADGIIKENLPSGIDSSVLAKLNEHSFSGEKETLIKKLIDELPTADEIINILSNCGAPTDLLGIDLPQNEEFINKSLLFSPYVRNRFTLVKALSAMSISSAGFSL